MTQIAMCSDTHKSYVFGPAGATSPIRSIVFPRLAGRARQRAISLLYKKKETGLAWDRSCAGACAQGRRLTPN